ncbi:MAG: hypothetical protein JJE04_16285 [Acidobacteriia bacterium]|nr:hypothetical protein [Terriglobia bacterium]
MGSFFRFWLLLSPALLSGAPMLRLTQTVVGPVSIAPATSGPAQEVEAFNAGDGLLNLTFTASASWVTASAGPIRNCSGREGSCIPIRIALPTQSLPGGTSSATLTVRDPNALDAPQNIIVTVQIGGGVPNRLDLIVAPNSASDEAVFSTNSPVMAAITTQSGGQWLSLVLDGLGSHRFVLPYKVAAQHLPGLPEGSYNGSIVLKDSGFAAGNKTPSQQSLRFRIAQNTGPQSQSLAVTNRGLGSLRMTGASASTDSGGAWLRAETTAGTGAVSVQADVAGLAPGHYKGAVEVSTNGVNSPLRVPVELEVVARSHAEASARSSENSSLTPERNQAVPKSLGIPNSRPARVGEAIVIYALGLGPTVPPVASGGSGSFQ